MATGLPERIAVCNCSDGSPLPGPDVRIVSSPPLFSSRLVGSILKLAAFTGTAHVKLLAKNIIGLKKS